MLLACMLPPQRVSSTLPPQGASSLIPPQHASSPIHPSHITNVVVVRAGRGDGGSGRRFTRTFDSCVSMKLIQAILGI